jgi:hypothetical protein
VNTLAKLIILISFFPLTSFSQNWQWEKDEGSPSGNDKGYSICTDGAGNCYMAGNSMGIGLISKYNSSGVNVWSFYVPNPSFYGGASICYFSNYIYYATDSLGRTFVSKYDLNGNFIWEINCGLGMAFGITPDNFGNLYVTGSGAFLVKVDTAGNMIWRKQNIYARGNSISADPIGNIYVTGYFSDTAIFDAHTVTALGNQDIFIAKFDSSGICHWVKRAGGNHIGNWFSEDDGYGIVADTSGYLYVTGSYVDTADFNSFTLASPNPNSSDVFLAKYDTSGNAIWVQQATGNSDQEGRCIAIDYQGNVLIGGSYVPDLYFNSYQLNGWGNYDAFVAKYDPNGNFISVISAGGATWNEYVYGICADNTGNIFVSGSFSDVAYFDADSLVSYGNYDIFIGKIDFTTGITEQVQNFSVNVFPNPAITSTTFQMNGLIGSKTIIIYDQLGKEIWRKETNENQIEFSVENLAAGLYFYRVEQKGEASANGKFIIR